MKSAADSSQRSTRCRAVGVFRHCPRARKRKKVADALLQTAPKRDAAAPSEHKLLFPCGCFPEGRDSTPKYWRGRGPAGARLFCWVSTPRSQSGGREGARALCVVQAASRCMSDARRRGSGRLRGGGRRGYTRHFVSTRRCEGVRLTSHGGRREDARDYSRSAGGAARHPRRSTRERISL